MRKKRDGRMGWKERKRRMRGKEGRREEDGRKRKAGRAKTGNR